jgi:hypothetical protein
MPKYLIERDIPGIGAKSAEELRAATDGSNAGIAKLASLVQWQHSYVTADKSFCVYLADNEELVREHARLTGFPVTAIHEVVEVLDPSFSGKPLAGAATS